MLHWVPQFHCEDLLGWVRRCRFLTWATWVRRSPSEVSADWARVFRYWEELFLVLHCQSWISPIWDHRCQFVPSHGWGRHCPCLASSTWVLRSLSGVVPGWAHPFPSWVWFIWALWTYSRYWAAPCWDLRSQFAASHDLGQAYRFGTWPRWAPHCPCGPWVV